ncbi:MAG: GDSL-type esterase/lipase family protein, partial [Gammaproteobacteria bacterium]|nr:GDSL-type esterase/lipase family protein [Gammaproteobacteria bacterium]
MSFSRFTAILRCGLFLFPLIVLSAPVQSASYNGIWTFDENSGTTANDTSGKNNHGSFNGSPSWGTGISGSGLSFSGGSDRVLVSDSPSLDFASGITLAAWIKPSQLATQYVIKKATSNTTDGYELGLSSSGVVFVRFNQPSSGNTYRLNSLSNYPTDSSTWMHVVATYDGAEIKLYINGALESTKAATLSIAKNNLSLAFGAQHDGLYPYAGMLDEIHVGPTALTALEVADLYASATATPTINILGLQQYGMQRSTDLLVQTSVSNVQASWGVRFNLISGAYTQEIQDYTAPFEHSFTALPQGDYRIEATLIDGVGVDVVSSNGKAVIDPYGIGEIYIAVGDSIIYGSNDDLSSDNISQDQRNTGGGFLPVLNDLLAQFRGYPNLFINEGVGGTNSADGITITSSALSNTPNAGYVIVGFGSNDRFGGRASGLGLSPGNGGYNNSYKDNMQQIVDMIFAAGKIPALGKIAIVYANCTSCSSFDDAQVEATNALIREYNQVV